MKVEEKVQIPREEYMNLLSYNSNEIYEYVYGIALDSIFSPLIYGFMHPNFKVINGDYYVTWKRWNSCD